MLRSNPSSSNNRGQNGSSSVTAVGEPFLLSIFGGVFMTETVANPDLFVQFLIDTSTIEQLAGRVYELNQINFESITQIIGLKKEIKGLEKEIKIKC